MSRFCRSLASVLLTAAVIVCTLALLLSGQLRLTLFASDWYQQAFSQATYVDGLRQGIEEDLAEQGAYVGIPAEILVDGLDDDSVYVMIRTHFQNLADFLNGRADFKLPQYPTSAFHEPILAYAREQAAQGGLPLTAEQLGLLDEIAADSAAIVQKRVAVADLSVLGRSAEFRTAHRVLFAVTRLPLLAGLALLLSLILLMLNERPFRRFLSKAAAGFWISGALLAVPLAVQEWFGLVRRLSVEPEYLKFALDRLLTSATRGLLYWGTALVLIASATMIALFFLEERLAAREKKRQRQLRRRQRRSVSSELPVAD